MFGVGLGLAILIDVLIVRLVIAPAVVTLLGDRAWWLPGWLDRLLPNVSLEGHLVDSVDDKEPALVEPEQRHRLDSAAAGSRWSRPASTIPAPVRLAVQSGARRASCPQRSRAEADEAIRAVVTRLSRPHPSGGAVIERAAIMAEGADSTAIITWIFAHAGRAEVTASTAPPRGLHGGRFSSGAEAEQGAPRRYVLPAGALT